MKADNGKHEENPNVTNPFYIAWESVLNTVRLWTKYQFLCLLLLTIFTGSHQQFQGGHFPLLIENKIIKFYVLSLYGTCLAISSKIVGKLSDFPRIGHLTILFAGLVCHCIFYGSMMIYIHIYDSVEYLKSSLLHILCWSIISAIGDACILTQLPSIYPILLNRKPEVFANYKFWQSGAAAIAYFMQTSISFQLKIQINFVLIILGMLPLFIVPKVRILLQAKRV